MNQLWLRRRDALVLLGSTVAVCSIPGTAVASAKSYKSAMRDGRITVAVGSGAGLDAAIRQLGLQAKGSTPAVIRHDEPWYAWSQTIAPQIARGGSVLGLADEGFGFCLERLAVEGRADFFWRDDQDTNGAIAQRLFRGRDPAVFVWRIHPRSQRSLSA